MEKIFNETNAVHHATMWLIANTNKDFLYMKYRKSIDKLYKKIYDLLISWLRDPDLQLNFHSFQPRCSFWQEGIQINEQLCKEIFQECFFEKKHSWSKPFVLYISQYYVAIEDRDIWTCKNVPDGAPVLF